VWNIVNNDACSLEIGRNVRVRICALDVCKENEGIEIVGPMIFYSMNIWCNVADLLYIRWYNETEERLVMASTFTALGMGPMEVFDTGRYFYFDLLEKGFPENDMNSIYVPAGRLVNLFDYRDCSYIGAHE